MNFLRHFKNACFGFRSYIGFLNLSLGSTLGYWAILSALLAGILMANVIHRFNIGYPAIVAQTIKHVPEFEIAGGEAKFSLPQPAFSNTNQFPIIVDTLDTLKEPEKMFPTGLIIHKKNMSFWMPDSRPLEMPWNKLPDGMVNATYLEKLGKDTLHTLPFMFPIAWLFLMLLGLIQAFMVTLLARFLERAIEPNFSFHQLFNIAIFALTPGSMLVAIYQSMNLDQIPYSMIYFGCYCAFLIMASGECRATLLPPDSKQDPED